MTGLLAVILAYVLGSIPFGYLLVRASTGRDVRDQGSGNIGATNVLRTAGKGAGVATLILDIAKGYGAVWLASYLTDGSPLWMSLAALAVMAGHAFPAFLGFKGGKAVAAFVGAFLYLTPLPMLAAMLVFLIMLGLTKHVSAGSMLAAGTFPFGVWLILHPPMIVTFAALVAGVFVVYRHIPNLERLRKGTESVFRWNGL